MRCPSSVAGAGPGTGLVLVFHGSKQTGEKFRAFTGGSFDALARTGGAVVAYLDGYKSQWNDARAASSFAARTENVDDAAFAQAMIRKLRSNHQIDSSKVYAAGFSNGGQMVIRLIHQVPGLMAMLTLARTLMGSDGSVLEPSFRSSKPFSFTITRQRWSV